MNGKGSKPRPLSIPVEEFGDRWDAIFAKKLTPEEWCKLKNVEIIDPDGWRVDNKPFSELITEREFNTRIGTSTIRSTLK